MERTHPVRRGHGRGPRLSEELFRNFMAHGPMVAFIKDADGRHLFMNELMQQVNADHIQDGWYGRTDFDFWPHDVAAKIRADDLEVLAGDEPREFAEPVPMPDGPHTWLTYKFAVPDPAGGRMLGGMAIDITERVKAEAERARLAAAVAQSTDGVMVTDAEARVVYINPAFERLTSLGRTEILGRVPPIFARDSRRDPALRDMRRTLRSGLPWSGDLRQREADGTVVYAQTAVSPVRGADGDLVGYVAVSRDMTEVRALEDELRQSQKMEAIGRLAGGVAHDFNNLLVAIQGYAYSLLRSMSAGDSGRGDVEQIMLVAERAAALTNQLLAFSRRQVLQPQLLDLNEVVGGVVPMLRRLIGENVELITKLGADVRPVFADRGQLEQVIVNLATNARDAMPSGGRLSIATACVAHDPESLRARVGSGLGPHVRLVVRDTGVGIDAATLPKIFEPFFTTKAQGRGTGLGLATVYGIVEQSGGNVRVQSQPGRGSAFIIELPIAPFASTAVRRQAVRRQAAQATPGASATVLLAEDDADVRAVAAAALREAGYAVLVAANGPEALRIAQRHRGLIDILVSDVVMPFMSGPALAKKLAAQRGNMKVLLISGYLDPDTVLSGGFHSDLTEFASDFLAKPFGPETLVARVRELVSSGE